MSQENKNDENSARENLNTCIHTRTFFVFQVDFGFIQNGHSGILIFLNVVDDRGVAIFTHVNNWLDLRGLFKVI